MSGTLRNTSPRLKNASEIENERSTSRSRFLIARGRRQSASPTRNTRQIATHTAGFRRVFPPNAPCRPRAICQATCGPVRTSDTRPVVSSIITWAICPASPDHAFTTHVRVSGLNVASVVGSGG